MEPLLIRQNKANVGWKVGGKARPAVNLQVVGDDAACQYRIGAYRRAEDRG